MRALILWFLLLVKTFFFVLFSFLFMDSIVVLERGLGVPAVVISYEYLWFFFVTWLILLSFLEFLRCLLYSIHLIFIKIFFICQGIEINFIRIFFKNKMIEVCHCACVTQKLLDWFRSTFFGFISETLGTLLKLWYLYLLIWYKVIKVLRNYDYYNHYAFSNVFSLVWVLQYSFLY